ncbi:Carboxylesterase 1D OS=Mus musculus GN=Ces1d PE=1 SV=1 [Rhizoctonia solani AG-1 IB]|uniref:Carboxylic ester hydrolase n=1 Tax=Thanatephorus cucumeris (strain AG1-IB / isolate 7/3/14) TaxID=1108050 RepID=A0A0B7G5N9_THACB|nr:Carboxylesterase 1D OS=Mus musculus GN=Ces1d PE=1 SV=1 [Rhizoctonia solani AG-1 IB]
MFIPNLIRAVSLLGIATTLADASPVPTFGHGSSNLPNAIGILCTLPIVRKLCRKDTGEVDVLTPIGMARGLQTTSTSSRFVVKYASASRWGLPEKANAWNIPNNDVNKMPPMCPQPNVAASKYSEDCLYMAIYTPVPSPSMLSSVPVLVWIHGGSFEVGSASDPGLDGAALAKATNSIVVVPQYRLGALGLVPPASMTGNSNLAVRDIITGLQFIRQVLPSFGGDINKITVSGQSSGAQMVRALLGTPSASSLFSYAALHSDTMDYGFYKPDTITNLQTQLYTNTQGPFAACSDSACQMAVSVPDIISAQEQMRNDVQGMYPVTASGSPIRPVHDGQLLQFTMTGNSFPSVTKPVLVMTVKDEAGNSIGTNLPPGFPDRYFNSTVSQFYGASRGLTIVVSENYNPDSYGAQAGYSNDDDKTRNAITQLFTDGYWRCPSWTFSRSWASKGGIVYTGEFQTGATYSSNQNNNYCKQSGMVCHQDDIYILFGTTPSPTPAQTALTQEIQSRYSSFVRSGNPNPSSSSYATWAQSGNTDVAALKLGGTGNRAPEACDPTFWGAQVLYDYQVYGL